MPIDEKKLLLRLSSFLLFSLAILLYLVPVGGELDQIMIAPWLDLHGHFFARNDWALVHLNHKVFKNLLIAVYISFFVLWCLSFKVPRFRAQRWQYGYMFWVSILSTGLIGLLKSQSGHACPWNMTHATASGFVWDFSAIKGHCFPGGHASTGFALMTGFFVYRLVQPIRAWFYLLAGIALGMMMGWGQMMRGAHFLSHNLWTGWIILLFNTIVYAYFYQKFAATAQSTSTEQDHK